MVQFGHGYDQTPLEIKTGSRSSMRIGMGAAKQGLLRSRRAVPYVIPIKDIPAPVSTDQDWIERQKRKGKRALATRESNGRKQPRFYDMDYSYGRIELSDRLLDMKPAPPPYSDTRWNYNVDQDPSAPPPETSDYGHKETPRPIPNPNQQDSCNDVLHMGIAVTLPNTGQCPTNNDPSVPPHKDPTDPNAPVPVPGEDPEPQPQPQPQPQDPPTSTTTTATAEDKKSTWENIRDAYNDVSLVDDALLALITQDPSKFVEGAQNSAATVANKVTGTVNNILDSVYIPVSIPKVPKKGCIIM